MEARERSSYNGTLDHDRRGRGRRNAGYSLSYRCILSDAPSHPFTPLRTAAQQHERGTTGMPSYTLRFIDSLYNDPFLFNAVFAPPGVLLHPDVMPPSLLSVLVFSFPSLFRSLCTKGNVVHDQFAAAARIEAIDEGSVTFKGKAGSRCSVCIASAIRSCFVCASLPSLSLCSCLGAPPSAAFHFEGTFVLGRPKI